MCDVLMAFLDRWKKIHPMFTGSMELHFRSGELRDIHTHQKHRDYLKLPKETDVRSRGHSTDK